MNFKENRVRLTFHVLTGILVLTYLLRPSLVKADRSIDYVPDGSAMIFLFKVNKNDPGVAALTGKALEKLSEGEIPEQVGQNILSLVSGEILGVAFPADSGKGDKLEYGIVAGYVRENFDFTISLRGNNIRMRAKSIPDLENQVLSPLIEQVLSSAQPAAKKATPSGDKNFIQEVFKGRQIVSLDQPEKVKNGVTAYSFSDGKILFGSTVGAVRELIRSHDAAKMVALPENSLLFYEPFMKGENDGILILDNTRGQLAQLIKSSRNLVEFGNILSILRIRKVTLSFNLVDEDSLTGVLDILPGEGDHLNLLEKEVQLLGAFLKARLFPGGLNWSNKVRKKDQRIRMEFKMTNLKKYFE